ncbi:MAG: hypothetical protein QM235_03450 [Pseudomonadota bacterium]|nr:hypothetical protein [Pseudomonadota bacterium]
MKKGIVALLFATTTILAISASILHADNIPVEVIKTITAESAENIKTEKVAKVTMQPGEINFQKTKGWNIFPVAVSKKNDEGKLIMTDKNAGMVFAEYEKVKPPLPMFNVKALNKHAYVGKPNYALVKAYVAQRPDNAEEYFATLASKYELMIYTKDKHTYFANLEGLDIKLMPALFFSYGEDNGKYINILVTDEDEVKNLHTGSVKTAVFKFYPAEMKVSAKGSINEEKNLYQWKGKREDLNTN